VSTTYPGEQATDAPNVGTGGFRGGHQGARLLTGITGLQLTEELEATVRAAATLLARSVAERHSAVVLDRKGTRGFKVGIVEPDSIEATDAVARALRTTTQMIEFVTVDEAMLRRLHGIAYPNGAAGAVSDAEIAEARSASSYSPAAAAAAEPTQQQESAARVTGVFEDFTGAAELRGRRFRPWEMTSRQFAEQIMLNVLYAKGSDIHVEISERGGVVRQRCDGMLYPCWEDIPLEVAIEVVNCIALMGRLESAQLKDDIWDTVIVGKFLFGGKVKVVEFRASFLPAKPFPVVCLRLSDDPVNQLEKVGFLGDDLQKIHFGLDLPQGGSLITGPTGSGKSNTMLGGYEYIQRDDSLKIIEIADPIEYLSDRRTQIQVTKKLTFARALKGSLRHDPDVIGLGECRDPEVATVAFNAAITGHRVPTTLHTSDVATTIARLDDFGIPRHLQAIAINLIISQRLVRRLCRCKVEDKLGSELLGHDIYMPREGGCAVCYGKGYRGREAVAEVLLMRPEYRSMLARGERGSLISQEAVNRRWMTPLKEAARQKLLDGVTSRFEVARVMSLTAYEEAESPDRYAQDGEAGGEDRAQQSAAAQEGHQQPAAAQDMEDERGPLIVDADFEMVVEG
jgi:type II secretory ATPase GspE/PulE/Tfp pilus assembly ATPase PilB-like protein